MKWEEWLNRMNQIILINDNNNNSLNEEFKMNDLIAKVFVAGIVMVFNFVTRKIFLEQK